MADESGEPPWSGWIETTGDALLILEAARRGLIPRVTRRLVDSERKMITSGSVFVFDEDESGIKRWTDGYFWSPSRILGNFLLYRETDKRGAGHRTRPAIPENLRNVDGVKLEAQVLSRPKGEDGGKKNRERNLVGSLTNTIKFKQDGLMKKTFSLTIGGVAQHLISYYKVEDVEQGRLRCPSSLPELACLDISPEYLDKDHFRNPPKVEIGPDGQARYRGEADDTETSPHQVLRKRSASVDGGDEDQAEGSGGPAKRARRNEPPPPPKRGRKKPANAAPAPAAAPHPQYPYAVPPAAYYAQYAPHMYAAAAAAAGSQPGTPQLSAAQVASADGTPQPVARGPPPSSSADNPATATPAVPGAPAAAQMPYPYPIYAAPPGYTPTADPNAPAGQQSQQAQQAAQAYAAYYQQYRYAWQGYPGYTAPAGAAQPVANGTPQPQNASQTAPYNGHAAYTDLQPATPSTPTLAPSITAPIASVADEPKPATPAVAPAVVATTPAAPELTNAERAAAAIMENMNFGLQLIADGDDDDDGEGEDEDGEGELEEEE